jgi:hypothetical protein
MQHHFTEVHVIEDQKIDSEKLNATIIGLAIRLAFLRAILIFGVVDHSSVS